MIYRNGCNLADTLAEFMFIYVDLMGYLDISKKYKVLQNELNVRTAGLVLAEDGLENDGVAEGDGDVAEDEHDDRAHEHQRQSRLRTLADGRARVHGEAPAAGARTAHLRQENESVFVGRFELDLVQ